MKLTGKNTCFLFFLLIKMLKSDLKSYFRIEF
ncbi:MAG: hypothetical protein K0S23_3328 [Fluviicola sp.]|jgi:hypothetical protein|nr:hypothetical protein [Fluviicola sp.]